MNLYAVRCGWGLFVVRAENETDAVIVALDDPSAGAAQYGHTRADLDEVTRLDPDGPAALLADHYG